MPTGDVVILIGFVSVFGLLAVTLAWAAHQTRRVNKPAGTSQ